MLGVIYALGFPTNAKLVFGTAKPKTLPSMAKKFSQFLLTRGTASVALFVPFDDPGLGGDHEAPLCSSDKINVRWSSAMMGQKKPDRQ